MCDCHGSCVSPPITPQDLRSHPSNLWNGRKASVYTCDCVKKIELTKIRFSFMKPSPHYECSRLYLKMATKETAPLIWDFLDTVHIIGLIVCIQCMRYGQLLQILPRGLCVGWALVYTVELFKNGWTDWDAFFFWGGGVKPNSCGWVQGTMYYMWVKTAQIHPPPLGVTRRWCGLLAKYFGHLLYYYASIIT